MNLYLDSRLKMEKLKVNNQVVIMRKYVKQAKIHLLHKLKRQILTLKKRKGNEKQLLQYKRKAERLTEKFALLKKIKPDSVSKLALSKAKDWKSLLEQKNISLQDQCLAMLANFSAVQAEVEKFHSENPRLVPNIPTLILEWEVKCQDPNFGKKKKPVTPTYPNNIQITKQLNNNEKEILPNVSTEQDPSAYNSNKKSSKFVSKQKLSSDIKSNRNVSDNSEESNGSGESEMNDTSSDEDESEESDKNNLKNIKTSKSAMNLLDKKLSSNLDIRKNKNGNVIDSEEEENQDFRRNKTLIDRAKSANSDGNNMTDIEGSESDEVPKCNDSTDENLNSAKEVFHSKISNQRKSSNNNEHPTKAECLSRTNKKPDRKLKKGNEKPSGVSGNKGSLIFDTLSSKCIASKRPKILKTKDDLKSNSYIPNTLNTYNEMDAISKNDIHSKLLKLVQKSNENSRASPEPALSHKTDPFFIIGGSDSDDIKELKEKNREKHFGNSDKFDQKETGKFKNKSFNDRASKFNKSDNNRFNSNRKGYENRNELGGNVRKFSDRTHKFDKNDKNKFKSNTKEFTDIKTRANIQFNEKNTSKRFDDRKLNKPEFEYKKQIKSSGKMDFSSELKKNKFAIKKDFQKGKKAPIEKNDEPLHPSWQAKKKLKEAVKTGFTGKRIVFDD